MITYRNVAFFLMSSMVLGLLDFTTADLTQLYLIELLGLLAAGATRTVALGISKTFDRVWHAGFLHKLKSYGISGQIFGLIPSFLSNRRLGVVQDGKFSQEYAVNAGVP